MKHLFYLLVVGVLLLAGCDSGDPINQPQPADVAGTYRFEELRFVPSASATRPADVKSRLEQNTSLSLSSGGNFVLMYTFSGEPDYIVSGDFDVRATTVRIRGSSQHRDQYQRLLLEPDFTLNRDPDNPLELWARISRNVDLQAYDREAYEGLTNVPGHLHIRLVRQQISKQ